MNGIEGQFTDAGLGTVLQILYRLGLRQTQSGVWTWSGKGCVLNVTLQSGENGIAARAAWTDGRGADVIFFDDVEGNDDLLFWLSWYVSGNRINEQGTIGYINYQQAA